jgi:hypothetical protein
MEFWRTILLLLRRRSVAGLVFLLALLGAVGGYVSTPTQYSSTATIVLTTPAAGGTLSQDPAHPNGLTNPLLNFDDSLRTSASMLMQALSVPEVTAEIGAPASGDTTLKVDNGASNPQLLGSNGPFIMIQATSTSPTRAHDVVANAELRAQLELVNRQKSLNVPRSTYISLVEVVPPSTPQAKSTTKLTLAVGGLLLGLAVGLGSVYWQHRVQEGRPRPHAIDVPEPRRDLVATATSIASTNGAPPVQPDPTTNVEAVPTALTSSNSSPDPILRPGQD